MKSNIRLSPTKDMSRDEWLAFRTRGLGASEVRVVMGLDAFKSSISLFYDKIGEGLGYTVENLAMFLGSTQEDYIAQLWEHWSGDVESMIQNYREGRKVRRCKKVNAYAHNDKYPWLFASLDREINQHEGRGNGCLELKTVGGWMLDKWQNEIPPAYVVQVQTQMLITEMDYGEIALLIDNRDFNVLPFEKHPGIFETIIERTKEFWDRVVEARKICTKRFEAERNFNMKAVEELNAELQTLEPEPDGSDAYNNFLKEKYRIAIPGERSGSLQELEDAKKHREFSDRIKELAEQKQLHENRLKSSIRDGMDKLTFGDSGYVSWKNDANGVRRFLNKIK